MERVRKNARELRKNMTKEERHLWYDFLKDYPVRFRRQSVIGPYIADFYCAGAKLVIELDGSQHYEAEGQEYDARRTAYLEMLGLEVVRIPNNEVMRNFRGVCEFLDLKVRDKVKNDTAPQKPPLHERWRGGGPAAAGSEGWAADGERFRDSLANS